MLSDTLHRLVRRLQFFERLGTPARVRMRLLCLRPPHRLDGVRIGARHEPEYLHGERCFGAGRAA